MRLRSYGRAEDDDYVFLELKKKYNGVVYKRRLKASLQEACGYMEGSAALPASSQIGREIDYFRSFYPDLKPRVYICYDRVAYYSLADRSFRMTFDKNIRWRRSDLNLSSAPCGDPLLKADQCHYLEQRQCQSGQLYLQQYSPQWRKGIDRPIDVCR